MHKEAIKSIKSKIDELVLICEISNNTPTLKSVALLLKPLTTAIMKHKSEWIAETDIIMILIEAVSTNIENSEKYKNSFSGKLTDALTEQELQKLTNELLESITSIPREYTAYLELPGTTSQSLKPIRLSENIEIISLDKSKPPIQDLSTSAIPNNKEIENSYYIAIRASGYAAHLSPNPTTRKTLSQLKTIIQLGTQSEVFNPQLDIMSLLLGLNIHGDYSIPSSAIIFVDERTKEISKINLEVETSRAINNINYDWVRNLELILDDNRDKNLAAQLLLERAAKLMERQDPDAKKIESAIEWLFDANSTKSKAMSLLQACIGLEAILGDRDSSDNITSILADRCAYIISNNIYDRPAIKELFKNIYRTRSKVVHGIINDLTTEKKDHGYYAKDLLSKVIEKELVHLFAFDSKSQY